MLKFTFKIFKIAGFTKIEFKNAPEKIWERVTQRWKVQSIVLNLRIGFMIISYMAHALKHDEFEKFTKFSIFYKKQK